MKLDMLDKCPFGMTATWRHLMTAAGAMVAIMAAQDTDEEVSVLVFNKIGDLVNARVTSIVGNRADDVDINFGDMKLVMLAYLESLVQTLEGTDATGCTE